MKTLVYTGPGQRIDSWLTSQFPYSRNFFQHIIERGGVRVVPDIPGDKVALVQKVKKSYKLQDGDSIYIENLERFLDGGILDECPPLEIRTNVPPLPENEVREYLSIMLEEEDYMVIYKPKGVLSHPNSVWDVSHPSVVGGLYHYIKKSEQRNQNKEKKSLLPSTENFMRAGLIHRLDKDTDGLMLIAKTEKGLTHFKNLFQAKSEAGNIEEKEKVPLKKYYRAVCEITEKGKGFLEEIGEQLPYIIQEEVIPKTPHPVIKEGITKILNYRHCEEGNESLDSGMTWQSPKDGGVGDCHTFLFDKLRVGSQGRVVIELEILTGRTHQIRYHLSNHGLPIVGDYLYGKEEEIPMQLTAWKLSFIDTYGKEVNMHL